MKPLQKILLAKCIFIAGVLIFATGLLCIQFGQKQLSIAGITVGLLIMGGGFFLHRCPHCGGILTFERWRNRPCPHCNKIIK